MKFQKVTLNHTVGGVAPTTPNLSFAPLHYALVSLHFAPAFCPFFFICLFNQINHVLQHIHIKKSCTLIFFTLDSS